MTEYSRLESLRSMSAAAKRAYDGIRRATQAAYSRASGNAQMTDLYSMLFRRPRAEPRRRPVDIDLSRDPPRTGGVMETPIPGDVETTRQVLQLRAQPSLGIPQRNRYLAEGVIEAERNAALRAGALPSLTERTIQGTYANGQVAYATRERSIDEIVGDATRITGAPSAYLSALIVHESGGKANARASTSTATGHAQFIDSTWLVMLHRYGGRYGEEGQRIADSIEIKNGVPRIRGWSSVMAAHYANENAAALRARLGRNVNEGEVYLAHFLGDASAANVIAAALRETTGRQQEARALVSSAAVEANPRIFYQGGNYERVPNRSGNGTHEVYRGGGRARTAREVYDLQTRRFRREQWPGQQGAPR